MRCITILSQPFRKDYPNIFVGYPGLPGFNGLAGYRMVCRFNDKLYFVSMGKPTATLVEVDPYTNEAQIAYYNNRFNRAVASGVHGLIVYDGEILMCLATDDYDGNKTPGGIIVASSDPSADLSKWRVIADQDDFDNLPAVMSNDGLNGGGIWDIIEYNGHLYVTVVTDKNIDGKINKQGFAMYRAHGCEGPSFTTIVSFGANAADPHHEPDDTVLKPGDCVLFDMGCIKDRYCSDMTRTWFCGQPTEKQAAVHDLVRRANEAAEALIKPGVRLCDLDAAARSLITAAGYGEYFNHRLGHFIGQTDHEKGDVSSANTAVAKPGMIFSIEPGIYLPGEFGVRIEDLVLVTETGCEVLNHNDKHWALVGQ